MKATRVVRGTTTAQLKEEQRKKRGEAEAKPGNPIAKKRWAAVRITVIMLSVIGLFGFVLDRFYDLMIEQSELSERAARESSGTVKLGAGGENHLDGHRGYIYDRNGYELAISVEVPSVFAHPGKIPPQMREQAIDDLASILDMPETEIREKLESDSPFIWVVRKATPAQGERIEALEIPGIGLKRESKRYYPGQDVAGQILGFSGMDNTGLAGIESAFDETLRGGIIELKGLKDARGQLLLTLETPMLNELEGSNVVLSIDQYIQRVTETAIERAAKDFDAKRAFGLVMNPYTGEMLAMAQYPRFNPNRFRDYEPDDWSNRIVLDSYEPGSVFKPYLYAMALDAGLTHPEEPIDDEGGRMRFTDEITISDTHTVENLTAEGVVVESSNIGSYKLAQRLGREAFYQGILAFGFGQRTGLGVPGESAGIIRPPKRWYEIDFANLAFGQGFSSTPLQLAQATAVLANGGELVRPTLFKEIRDRNGNIIRKSSPVVRHRVVSEEAARTTRLAMEKVVTEGTGLRAWVDGYRVGGKTGTPQKAKNGRYVNKWMANFVGIAPIDDPELVIIVVVDEPRKSHLGGMVAAPAFAEIASQVLPYVGVYPDPVYSGDSVRFPTMVDTREEVAGEGVGEPAPEGELPEPTLLAENLTAVRIDPDAPPTPGYVRVPDFAGMSLPQALGSAVERDLHLDASDTGFVVEQWPAPGTEIEPGAEVQVTLSRRYRQQSVLGIDP